jgi:hypothetical protein
MAIAPIRRATGAHRRALTGEEEQTMRGAETTCSDILTALLIQGSIALLLLLAG